MNSVACRILDLANDITRPRRSAFAILRQKDILCLDESLRVIAGVRSKKIPIRSTGHAENNRYLSLRRLFGLEPDGMPDLLLGDVLGEMPF